MYRMYTINVIGIEFDLYIMNLYNENLVWPAVYLIRIGAFAFNIIEGI